MCLTRQTPNKRPVRYGYQILRPVGGGYRTPFLHFYTGRRVSHWQKAQAVWIKDHQLRRYTSGFHVFHRKRDAFRVLKQWFFSYRKCVVVRVEVRNITAVGVQRFRFLYGAKPIPITVAAERRIIEEVSES